MTMEEQQETKNPMNKFAQLPGGVQRVIIAVILVLLLIGAMLLMRMIRTEEEVAGEELPETLAGVDAGSVMNDSADGG